MPTGVPAPTIPPNPSGPANPPTGPGAELESTPTPAPLPLAARPEDLVESSFDQPGLIDYHPVADRGPITSSAFDEEDRIDRHPVP